MFMIILLKLKRFWMLALEMDVRYTSVPVWTPWRDFTFSSNRDSEFSWYSEFSR
jgi:hypothetical protein